MDRFATYLAETFGCSQVISISSSASQIPRAELARSILIGAIQSYSSSADDLLTTMRRALDLAPAGLLVAPAGPPLSGPSELKRFLSGRGFAVPFTGWIDRGTGQLAAILENNGSPRIGVAPPGFRVVAFMPAFNEADIISQSLQYLIAQGVEVYVLDNWSTDGTAEQVERFLGAGVIGLERFPRSGPVATYEWLRILSRLEELARAIPADWFMLHDADERRFAPWRGVSLKRGLHHADRCGFNCVDHVVVHHWPTRERFDPSASLESQLPFYTFSDHPGHFHQRRAWKNPHCDVSIAPSAGHDVRFPGRLVYPFKFLLRHYPIRSQEHGERKVFAERVERWNSNERSLGWHRQYDEITRGHSFLRDRESIDRLDQVAFEEEYLIQRLSGIGVFGATPAWATGPRERFEHAPVANER